MYTAATYKEFNSISPLICLSSKHRRAWRCDRTAWWCDCTGVVEHVRGAAMEVWL